MQTVEQIESTVSEVLSADSFAGVPVVRPVRVEEFGGTIFIEILFEDVSRAEEAKIALERRLGDSNIFLSVRGIWHIAQVGEPEIAYGPNGSPRAAAMVPVTVRSGLISRDITISVTKLAEMELARILGGPANLKRIATLVVENKLKLGGSSAWNPADENWLEVNSANAAELSRSLRKIA